MSNYELIYQDALQKIENSIYEQLQVLPSLSETDIENTEKSSATLDAWDYCYAIAIGLAGVFIATNEAFAQYLDQIHKAASGSSGEYDRFQSFLGDALHHQGDNIDAIDMPFKNRNGGNAYCIFHRLLWGHDILSNKGDNPFQLMFNQKSLSGVLQAVRHLIADTASKQGIPIPGSSYLDVVDDNNKTSNYLIKIAQQLSEESVGTKSNAQEIYSHMMTIRAQDISSGIVVKLITELYFRIRKIKDNIRRSEIRLIAYTVNFLGEAVIGCFRQNGVPYINIPLAVAMTTSFAQFCYYNKEEIKKISLKTKTLHDKTEFLERKYNCPILELPEVNDAEKFLVMDEIADRNFDELLSFFGEDIK